jgi:hypothetical protein
MAFHALGRMTEEGQFMTSSARVSRALLAAAALALAGAIAGCSGASSSSTSSPPPGSGATSAPAASTPADSGSTSSASAPVASSSPSQAGGGGGSSSPAGNPNAASPGNPGLQPCSSRYLRADPGTSEGAAGSIYLSIKFVNLNNVACTLYGYPGVSLAAGTPVTQVGAAADRVAGSARTTVTLQPQGVASALLRITQAVNYPAANCGPMSTTWIQIFPPGQTAPLYMAYKSTGCTKSSVHLLTIDVVKAGSGG